MLMIFRRSSMPVIISSRKQNHTVLCFRVCGGSPVLTDPISQLIRANICFRVCGGCPVLTDPINQLIREVSVSECVAAAPF